MKVKNISALLCALLLAVSLLPAANASTVKETVIDLGDGYYAVETVEFIPLSRAGDTVRGAKNINLYHGSTLIGTTTLGGVFEVSGSTVKAISGNITGTGYNGWSYSSGSTRCSGATVYGTATYRSEDGVTKTHSSSITYTP